MFLSCSRRESAPTSADDDSRFTVIGLDFGDTKTTLTLTDPRGNILARRPNPAGLNKVTPTA